jgi:D-glycero-D-manno-heptose 1,7-bisphosphate phosphatase
MRAIFLDRDGVICGNRSDYIKSWDEFIFLARAREGLARLAALDMPIVVVTNQSAINRNLLSVETLTEIHRHMVTEIKVAGGRIDRIYYCPHRPDEGCRCRKPRPGMLKRAAADLGIELKGSYMIGDAWTDVQAGLSVGCTSFLVLTGRGLRQAPQALQEGAGLFRVGRELPEAVTTILHAEGHSIHQMTWSRLDGNLTTPSASPRFGSGSSHLQQKRPSHPITPPAPPCPQAAGSTNGRQRAATTLSQPPTSEQKGSGLSLLLPRRSPLKQPG